MSTAGSPITAGPLKWSDIASCSSPVSEFLFDQALEGVEPGHEQILAALHLDERGKIEQEGLLCAGDEQLRTFAADTVDGVLLVWIESDELAAFHPFALHELEMPLDICLDEQIY